MNTYNTNTGVETSLRYRRFGKRPTAAYAVVWTRNDLS